DAVQVGGAFDHVQALVQQSSACGAAPTRIAAANLNPGTGDGHDALTDVVTSNWNSGGVNVLLNASTGGGGGGTGPAVLTVAATAHSHDFLETTTVDLTHAFDKITYEID